PRPSLTDGDRTVSATSLRGRWYLLNVWGSWCGTCREEHSMLLEVRQSGLVPLIGLDWKDDDAQALSWLQQLGNPYEVVAVDREGRTAIDWGVYAAPESFLVNPRSEERRVGKECRCRGAPYREKETKYKQQESSKRTDHEW